MVGWSATLFCVKHQSRSFHNMAAGQARIQLLRCHEKLGSCLSSSPFLYLVEAQRFCNAKWCKSLFWTLLNHLIPLLASSCIQHYRCHLSFCFTSKTLIITFSFFVFNGSSLLFYSLFSDSCLLLLVPTFSSLSCLLPLVPTSSFSLLLCCLLSVPTSFYLLLSWSSVGPYFFLPSLILSSVGPHFFFLWDQLLLSLFFFISFSSAFSSVLFLNLWQIGSGWTSTPFEWEAS